MHQLVLSTDEAREAAVLRLLEIVDTDVVSVTLSHLSHTPYTFTSRVNTFLDLWIDPFEFDCLKYDMP